MKIPPVVLLFFFSLSAANAQLPPGNAFGDSITQGVGASAPGATAYVPLLAASLGRPFVNRAVSGDCLADQIRQLYTTTIYPDSLSTLLVGTNDSRIYRNDPDRQDAFRQASLASLIWLGIPDGAKIRGRDSRWSLTGAWNYTGVYFGIQSTTGSSTASVTVAGSVIALASTVVDEYAGGQFQVQIDGMIFGPFFNAPTGRIRTLNGAFFAPKVWIFDALSNGPHRVSISVLSATGPKNYVGIEWLAGWHGPQTPAVVVGNIPRQTISGYAYTGTVPSLLDKFDSIVAENVRQARNLGINISVAGTNDFFSAGSGTTSDGVHPNDTGYRAIADAFLAAMQP